jgi:serine protease inhibitor
MTFDKPFMYLIINKDTNEVWFVGQVYEPQEWKKNY